MAYLIPVAGPLASPHTQLASGCNTNTATEAELDDLSVVTDPGSGKVGVVVFCVDEFKSKDPADYEVLTYTAKNGGTSEIEGLVSRAGTKRSWPAGTWVASYGTGWAWDQVWAAIADKADAIHNLVDTTNHPVSGLTTGHFLKASGATAYGFAAHGLSASDVSALPTAGGTMSGELNMADQFLTRPKIKDYSEVAVVTASVSGNTSINVENGNVIQHTLSDAVAYTVSNPSASGTACSFTLIIIQPAAAKAVTWFSNIKWPGGTLPDIATNNGIFIFTFVTLDAGTTWYGFLSGNDMKAVA